MWIILFASVIIKKKLYLFDKPLYPLVKNTTYNYQCDNTEIDIYDSIGRIKFKLTAQYIQHCSDQKITWFKNPRVTVFDEKNVPTWKITANQAKLNCEKKLYLYGRTCINNLTNNTYIQSITADQATINLNTQDIISNDQVTIHGNYFHSVGMKMHANLRTKTIKLMDNIQTNYEIQNIW